MLLSNVAERLAAYERHGLHYHLAAMGIYAAREEIGDVFSPDYQPYIIAGLIAYDMARFLGDEPYGREKPYKGEKPYKKEFALRLREKLEKVKTSLEPILLKSLSTVEFDDTIKSDFRQAYDTLTAGGTDGLHESEKRFCVGASKILHWLNPELFIMLDSHISKAFYHHPTASIPLWRAGAPVYTPDNYLRCLELAQREIIEYGEARLRRDGKGLPLANIYGNTAFQYALEIGQERDTISDDN